MSQRKDYPTITVGDLKRDLAALPDHYTLDFSGLTFYRIKLRGPTHAQVEFGQNVYRDESGRVHVDNLD